MIDENNKLSLGLNGSGGSFGGIGDVSGYTSISRVDFNNHYPEGGVGSTIMAGNINNYTPNEVRWTTNTRGCTDWTNNNSATNTHIGNGPPMDDGGWYC